MNRYEVCLHLPGLVCLSVCQSASLFVCRPLCRSSFCLPVTCVDCSLQLPHASCGTAAPSQPEYVPAHTGLRPAGPAVRHQRLPGRRREAHHEQAQRHREGRAARRRAGRGRTLTSRNTIAKSRRLVMRRTDVTHRK